MGITEIRTPPVVPTAQQGPRVPRGGGRPPPVQPVRRTPGPLIGPLVPGTRCVGLLGPPPLAHVPKRTAPDPGPSLVRKGAAGGQVPVLVGRRLPPRLLEVATAIPLQHRVRVHGSGAPTVVPRAVGAVIATDGRRVPRAGRVLPGCRAALPALPARKPALWTHFISLYVGALQLPNY